MLVVTIIPILCIEVLRLSFSHLPRATQWAEAELYSWVRKSLTACQILYNDFFSCHIFPWINRYTCWPCSGEQLYIHQNDTAQILRFTCKLRPSWIEFLQLPEKREERHFLHWALIIKYNFFPCDTGSLMRPYFLMNNLKSISVSYCFFTLLCQQGAQRNEIMQLMCQFLNN